MKHLQSSLGISILEPHTKFELQLADAYSAFSTFVLEDEAERCISIIEKHLSRGGDGGGVGYLSGGGDEYDIYRLNIAITNNDDNHHSDGAAASELLDMFHNSHEGKRYRRILTYEKLTQYMIGMCERHRCESEQQQDNIIISSSSSSSRRYDRVGNLMLILNFGPTPGQIRHIDNTDGNLFVSVYMSTHCPSTVLYEVGDPFIECTSDLIDYWDDCYSNDIWKDSSSNNKYPPPAEVPLLIRDVFNAMGNEQLGIGKRQHYTSKYKFWGTINRMLQRFGRLYQPIEQVHKFEVDPGTTFVAGGNEVHAGPPTFAPRMFAFAIGIPEDEEDDELLRKSKYKHSTGGDESSDEGQDDEDEENNGEVQYFPVLFHLDLCSIVFGIMEHEYNDRSEEHYPSKVFLLRILIQFICEYPSETYTETLGSTGREELQLWFGRLRTALNDGLNVDNVLDEAASDKSVVFSRRIVKRGRKSKRR
ncbi:hypothetical protein ACHAWC_002986 [Mediolabrus comicus]